MPEFLYRYQCQVSELGRRPHSARNLFIKHTDRILFGSDFGPCLDAYQLIYRSLETDDEYFNCGLSIIRQQGRWHIYGIHLPDDSFKKIYHDNEERVLKFT